MFRPAIALIAVLLVGGADRLYAQESGPGPGTVEVTVIPAGGTFFTNSGNGSSFGNYNVGAAATYNINRIVGIEGEVGSSIGISQNLTDGSFRGTQKTPNTLTYTGNVVLSAPTRSSIVPYATGGVGALTMLHEPRHQQHRDVPDERRRRPRTQPLGLRGTLGASPHSRGYRASLHGQDAAAIGPAPWSSTQCGNPRPSGQADKARQQQERS